MIFSFVFSGTSTRASKNAAALPLKCGLAFAILQEREAYADLRIQVPGLWGPVRKNRYFLVRWRGLREVREP